MSDTVECVVVGAGVVGLAIARSLALSGHEVIVIEAEDSVGTQTSSRNSEVIHAGIYYPQNSLKAIMCVHGKKLLYEYCDDRQISYSRLGKIIVATNTEETDVLKDYVKRAELNNVNDLTWLSAAEVKQLEPSLFFESAVISPSTGIIDSHGLMISLQGDAENNGALIVFNSIVENVKIDDRYLTIKVGGSDPTQLRCKKLINCAGLEAVKLAKRIVGFPAENIPKAYFGKAHYYTLSRRSPFSHLIYPVNKSSTSLGVHVTLDLSGQARFGPDITWIKDINYDFDRSREKMFYESIRKYFPDLRDGELMAGYTGIRPKISGPDEPAADFRIEGPRTHGFTGVINLFGIESPGLTASLAIGEHVTKLVAE